MLGEPESNNAGQQNLIDSLLHVHQIADKMRTNDMTQDELAQLDDQELINLVKQNKPTPLFDAFFIGVLIGILVFGFASNGWFWLAVIPLFLIHQILRKPKQFKAMQAELDKRNLDIRMN